MTQTCPLGATSAAFQVIGDTQTVTRAIDASTAPFYVYVLLPPSGQPFYVGKGVGPRILQHEPEARNTTRPTHKLNVIRAIHRSSSHMVYAIADFFTEEAEAHARERRLILK